MNKTSGNPNQETGAVELPSVGTLLGKRYVCGKCGTEVLCSKSGAGQLWCCGGPMKLKEAMPLPSSD